MLKRKQATITNIVSALEKQELAVRCSGVTKTYGSGHAKVAALRGVDLEVRQGELLMVVGPSGCGKTSLISIIAAILDLDGGICEVLGRDVSRIGEKERVRFRGQSIGLVFQEFNLLPALTAVENVSVPLLLRGTQRKPAEAAAREILQSVGLAARMDARPLQMSGGEKQRVAIARALVHNPKLIVCDEPTSNLDHETGRRMMAILRGVAQSPDRALIVVTHDTRILEFADRIARMEDGRIVEITRGGGQQA